MSPGRSSSNANIVDATLLAARGSTIERAFPLSELPRLSEWSAGEQARLAVTFYMADKRVALKGHATVKLKLTCQRCLGSMLAPVDDEFDVVIVGSESDMDELPEQQEAIIADATRLDLAWVIEEQLLLATPLVPAHASIDECSGAKADSRAGEKRERTPETIEEAQRPFAQLRELMAAKKPR